MKNACQRYDLSTCSWSLTGWHPGYWKTGTPAEPALGMVLLPDVAALPARVPGSVHQALRDQNLLPDWNVQLNSRQAEWVEHRDWKFETELPARWTRQPGRKVLCAEGLDYAGYVLVNGRVVAPFRGSFTPHRFDLTAFLQPGANRLAIVFTEAPYFLGQIGRTSEIREWKPRFNYGWDWVPRLVSAGIYDTLSLEVRHGDALSSLSLHTAYDARRGAGRVHLRTDLALKQGRILQVQVLDGRRTVATRRFRAKARLDGTVAVPAVQPWQPNGVGTGRRNLYTVRVQLLDAQGQVLDEARRTVGFREVTWHACHGAPAGAEPWICRINGRDTFLQGFNWVPPRPHFADVTEAEYRRLLTTYRDLGANILRVWGGAALERACFYRLCDEMGLMVWQEFPLSSSGCDNLPPDDAIAVREMAAIAESYVRRCQHHPALLIWCGGNELTERGPGGVGGGKPLTARHPMVRRMEQIVHRLDPARRFVPTSPSGPRFCASAKEWGQGCHHDVHGPWNHKGPLETWRAYWDGDDSLFRSEVGMPGASSASVIRRYTGVGQELPADAANPYWRHVSSWWLQWDAYLSSGGSPRDLDAYVRWSQQRQAAALGYAARACKRRFPACGGFMVWMGHDCFPCPENTAVIQFDGRLKPAARALRKVFRNRSLGGLGLPTSRASGPSAR